MKKKSKIEIKSYWKFGAGENRAEMFICPICYLNKFFSKSGVKRHITRIHHE